MSALTENQIQDMFQTACAQHQKGNLQEAKSLYTELLNFFPNAFLLNYNLALLYYEEENFSAALRHYELAAKECPDDPDAFFNIGLCHKKLGSRNAAISAFNSSLELQGDRIDTLYNLASCYREDHNWEQAEDIYVKVLQIDAYYLPALSNLAYTCQRLGKKEEALLLYHQVIALNPDHKSAQHMISCLSETSITHTEIDYVRELFDNYSENFEDDLLKNLYYQVPALLKQELIEIKESSHIFEHVLDLGCGTGLVGIHFTDVCKNMTGVDIATKMVKKASEKGIYNKVVASDINLFFQNDTEQYDLFIAADVFSYIGGLEETFENITKAALPGALICFSVEQPTQKIDHLDGYKLGETGRFMHSAEYIKNLCDHHELRLHKQSPAQFRQEASQWVQGWIFVLEKP